MKKSDIIETVNARLDKLGVKSTSRSVRAVPSYVEIKVIAGGHAKTLRLSSGLHSSLVEDKLSQFERALADHTEAQGDIETACAAVAS
jgi:hypothetical protein